MPSAKATAVLLGLVAVSTASPINPSPAYQLVPRQDGTCPNANLSSPEQAAGVWNDLSIGKTLDDFLSSNGESGWVVAMANKVFPNAGDTFALGCADLGEACLGGIEAPDTCEELTAQGYNAEYWILNSVFKLHTAIKAADRNLQVSIIDSMLTTSAIKKDFDSNGLTDDRIMRWVAAAFGIVSGALGFPAGAVSKGFKDTASMMGGAFSAGGTTPPVVIDPTADMDAALKSIFAANLDGLKNYLALAVGAGEGETSSLPDQGGDYKNSIAKFFTDGRFLVQGSGDIDQYFSAGYTLMNKKLVDVAIQKNGYSVTSDKYFETAETCAEVYGAHWLDELDGGRCMRFMHENPANSGVMKPAPDSVYKNAEEKYGMNMLGYFQNVCDCGQNGSGEPDTENLPLDGSIPQCFYNTPCLDSGICYNDDGAEDPYNCWASDNFFTDDSPPPEPTPAPPQPKPSAPAGPSDVYHEGDGCYGSGMPWVDLTGDGSVTAEDVTKDIVARCQSADGTKLGLNGWWWDCTEWTKSDGGKNHIWWEIIHEGDENTERTITTDICTNNFKREIGGCSMGSQQTGDGFWWKHDPQEGECPFKKS